MAESDAESGTGGSPSGYARFLPAIILTASLFFLWGVANNLNDVLIAQFKKAFILTDLQSGLVQSAFYMGYFLLAVPASLLMRRAGYKAAIVLGLLLYAAGAFLFYPAAQMQTYGLFLAALFVIAAGLAFLETSANPLMTELGPPETAAFRLNLAQAFNPLGAISGVLIGSQFILSGVEHDTARLAAMSAAESAAYYRGEIEAVQAPYLAIGGLVLVWAVLVMLTRFPAAGRAARHATAGEGRFLDVLRRPRLLAAALAQFLYVGAQVGVWSFTIRYAQSEVAGMSERAAAHHLTFALVLFMIGRFAGTALMRRVPPVVLLAAFAVIAALLSLFAALAGGTAGLYALIAVSLFMSIQFPTIFALGIEGLGPLRTAGSSLLIMAIIGGAVLTAVMGRISDLSHIAIAMLVPAACFLFIAGFAVRLHRQGVALSPEDITE